MRITVADVLGWLAAGRSHQAIIADYPELTEEDILACLAYAADRERRLLTAARSCCQTICAVVFLPLFCQLGLPP